MMDGEAADVLPTGWTLTSMGQIGRYLNGFAFSSKTWARSGRPIIRIQNLTGSGSEFNYFEGEIEDRYIVRDGDLLFSWAATLGVFVWRGPEAVLNQHIFKVESRVNKSFHRYLIEHKIAEMMQQTHGTGMVHITKKKFDAVPVFEPPMVEQEKIVEILEEQLSRLDAAMVSVCAIREKSMRFRRSLLHAVFSGAMTENLSGKESDDIRIFRFEDLFEVAPNRRRQVKQKEYKTSGDFPVVDQGEGLVGGFVDDVELLFDGQLPVIVFGDHTRRLKFVDFPFVVGADGTKLIRCKESVLPRFGYYHLEAAEFRNRGYARHFAELKKVKFWRPDVEAQEQIIQLLDEQFSRLDTASAIADLIEKKASALRRSLLHAAFTGNLTKEWREGAHV